MSDQPTDTQPVTLILRGKEYLVPANITVAQAFKRIGIQPDSHLAVRKGEVITEDQLVRPGDTLRVVPVISGGGVHEM